MRPPLLTVAALLVSGATSVPAWYTHYERGISLLAQGDAQGAYAELQQALAARGEEGLKVHTEGVRYVDYLPHIYLAVAAHMGGNVAAARAHLESAERSGVAARSEVGRTLLEGYRLLINPTGTEATAASAGPPTVREPAGYRRFVRRPPVLPEAEIREVSALVAARCGLPAQGEITQGPWYFFYEMGLELETRGDPQAALDYLIAAADRRPRSARLARTYGMWFMDYRPYLEIGRAHSSLGNWSCALDDLELSERLREVTDEDGDYACFRDLLEEARSHGAQVSPR